MVLVTGAAGFVGSNIARRLRDEKFDVVGIDDLSFGDKKNIPEDIIFRIADFKTITQKDLNKADILIHCATSNIIYSQKHPIETFKNNAENTIELFKRFNEKIIYLSTCSVYGNANKIPTSELANIQTLNAYDLSKRIAELYLQRRGNFTTLRLSNVYGINQRASSPYCGIIGRLIDCLVREVPFIICGSGIATRDYTYVRDVETAVLKSVREEATDTEINIGTGVEMSVQGLCDMVDSLCKTKIKRTFGFNRDIDTINRRCLDVSKAYELLGWLPETTLEAGIKKTLDWYTEFHIKNL